MIREMLKERDYNLKTGIVGAAARSCSGSQLRIMPADFPYQRYSNSLGATCPDHPAIALLAGLRRLPLAATNTLSSVEPTPISGQIDKVTAGVAPGDYNQTVRSRITNVCI